MMVRRVLRLTMLTGLLMAAMVGLQLASAPEIARADDGETATTELQPGWNLAGWTGEEAEVAAIFEAIPELETVYAWDAEARSFRGTVRVGADLLGELDTLTPGIGLWLHVSGNEPVTWTRPLFPQSGAASLTKGWNLVTWAGRDGIATDEALKALGDIVVEAQGVDGSAPTTLATGSATTRESS